MIGQNWSGVSCEPIALMHATESHLATVPGKLITALLGGSGSPGLTSHKLSFVL